MQCTLLNSVIINDASIHIQYNVCIALYTCSQDHLIHIYCKHQCFYFCVISLSRTPSTRGMAMIRCHLMVADDLKTTGKHIFDNCEQSQSIPKGLYGRATLATTKDQQLFGIGYNTSMLQNKRHQFSHQVSLHTTTIPSLDGEGSKQSCGFHHHSNRVQRCLDKLGTSMKWNDCGNKYIPKTLRHNKLIKAAPHS